MTPGTTLRPVLLGLLGLATASCGMVEGDPRRFESLAERVAGIPLDDGLSKPRPAPVAVSAEAVRNPGALRVEVMDPHTLWDARDLGLRGAIEQAGPAVVAAAAPVVTQAVMQKVAPPPSLARPDAVPPKAPTVVAPPRETLQLGAFASPAAARAAWTRISAAGSAVATLTPAFETVNVDGRALTRLKVSAPAEVVRAVCRAADAADLGCLRRG